MTSFFQNVEINSWLPINGIFNTMTLFHPEHGYATRDLEKSLDTCLSNCTFFNGRDRTDCEDYCNREEKSFQNSIKTPTEMCEKSSDPFCCKKHAGSNEYAFLMCREKVNLPGKKQKQPSRENFDLLAVLCALFLLVMVFLIFIYIF